MTKNQAKHASKHPHGSTNDTTTWSKSNYTRSKYIEEGYWFLDDVLDKLNVSYAEG